MTVRSADFESAASACSAIRAITKILGLRFLVTKVLIREKIVRERNFRSESFFVHDIFEHGYPTGSRAILQAYQSLHVNSSFCVFHL